MLVKKLRWFVLASFVLILLLLPVPALLAPHVSEDPVHWAYRVYHPFMYRYPAIMGASMENEVAKLSPDGQSLAVLRLMIKYW